MAKYYKLSIKSIILSILSWFPVSIPTIPITKTMNAANANKANIESNKDINIPNITPTKSKITFIIYSPDSPVTDPTSIIVAALLP